MPLLENKSEIKAAIAIMHPVARSAAQGLANYLQENPETLKDDEARDKAYYGICFFAMEQAGWDMKDEKRMQDFFENHGQAVLNVAASIVVYAIKESEKQRKWGWLGKAAAFVVGAIVTSFFN
jgi:hypothetical protein